MGKWAHIPEVPIRVSPLWSGPPKPLAAFEGSVDAWFPLTVHGTIAGLAVASLARLSPALETVSTPSPGWRALQGTRLEHDPRPFPRQGRGFTFGRGISGSHFWTIASGVTVRGLFEGYLRRAMAKGWVSVITFETNPARFVVVFFPCPVRDILFGSRHHGTDAGREAMRARLQARAARQGGGEAS